MKYIAVFDDDFLTNFRLDDNGLTLVVRDKCWVTRAVKLQPLISEILVFDNGKSVYLDKDHIDALIDYERNIEVKKFVTRLIASFEDIPMSKRGKRRCEMSIDDAINIIENEKACVLRNIQGCNRDCANCDLVLPDEDIISAYNYVIAVLQGVKYGNRKRNDNF